MSGHGLKIKLDVRCHYCLQSGTCVLFPMRDKKFMSLTCSNLSKELFFPVRFLFSFAAVCAGNSVPIAVFLKSIPVSGYIDICA